MRAKSSILFLCLLAAFAGAALAQTPDGQTPAEETVCDGFSGASFGLCNAYCEAMDCELENDGDPNTNPSASSNACDKVRANFSKKSGIPNTPADVDAVCATACPCSVATNWNPPTDASWQFNIDQVLTQCTVSGNISYAHSGQPSDFSAVDSTSGAAECIHGQLQDDGTFFTLNTLSVTDAQAAACLALLKPPCM